MREGGPLLLQRSWRGGARYLANMRCATGRHFFFQGSRFGPPSVAPFGSALALHGRQHIGHWARGVEADQRLDAALAYTNPFDKAVGICENFNKRQWWGLGEADWVEHFGISVCPADAEAEIVPRGGWGEGAYGDRLVGAASRGRSCARALGCRLCPS